VKKLSLIEFGFSEDCCPAKGQTFLEVLGEFHDEQSWDVRQRCVVELHKPGEGLLRMDFCTLGMFIIGGSAWRESLVAQLSNYR
jgi:hypothetical protein